MKHNYYKPGDHNAICSDCNIEKASTEYYLNSNGKPSRHCKACHLESGKKWRLANPIKCKEIEKRGREKNRAKMLASTRKWRKANLAYDAQRQRERSAVKLQAMPHWANKEKILEIYKHCPKGYHVDHIIPLRGKLVNGLHVENNLQYLLASENYRKGNSYVE